MAATMRARSASSRTSARAHDDEQRHVRLAPEVLEVDDEAVRDLRQRFHRAIELARAHADAVTVDRRVGAAVDDRAAART
jgi:hypothetical protein